MKRYFITGTDTDCGKTYFTCQLLNFLNQQGKLALAVKPVASGCHVFNKELISDDLQSLSQYNRFSDYDISPWRFTLPVSPHIAAIKDNRQVLVKEIIEYCDGFLDKPLDCLLVEGAGGLMVPLNDKETWLDFLKWSQIPVLFVVGMRLGCLNHALLTDAMFTNNKINCIGWIANCVMNDMLALEENIETLKTRLSMPLLTVLPYHGVVTSCQFI